jgi:predicted nucleic acid-binding protein
MKYLLDTNIIINLVRNDDFERNFNETYRIPQNTLITSVVVLGELEAFALKQKWGKNKIKGLKDVIAKLIIYPIRIQQIINRYAEVDAYSQNKLDHKPLQLSARNMGKNDLWIAATASVYKMTLMTMDKDFEHLDEAFLELEMIFN